MISEDVRPPESPPRLTLVFSNAATAKLDHLQLDRDLYGEDARAGIQGSGQVIVRHEDTIREALQLGRVAFLTTPPQVQEDGDVVDTRQGAATDPLKDRGEAVGAVFAYHATHEHLQFTEVGSAMVSLNDFGVATLLIAVLSLKEHLSHVSHDYRPQVAAIQSENHRSIKAFEDHLGWRRQSEEEAQTNFEVVGRKAPPGQKTWFRADARSRVKMAQVILDVLVDNESHLFNKKTGQYIPVDLSALDAVGLTEEKLNDIAHPHVNWRTDNRLYLAQQKL